MKKLARASGLFFLALLSVPNLQVAAQTAVSGSVVDAETMQPVECRLYIKNQSGEFFFPTTSAVDGAHVPYHKQNRLNPLSVESHVTLSAHPWRIELVPGIYELCAERGKEYFPVLQTIEVGTAPVEVQLPLKRWVNMASLGWYSGDTHLHRTVDELKLCVLAEDLNVAFPMTYWTTDSRKSPATGNKTNASDANLPAKLIRSDASHVIWPKNTEWEINFIGEERHTLGAFFALNHQRAFEENVPPLGPAIASAVRDGALFDMDKPDWPWSPMLPHLLSSPLYELANNHMWRTEFGITQWFTPAPSFMELPNEGRSGSERDWMEYVHRTYWVLLNCGYRCSPTAGTASGVHPVPPGFGRVYVSLDGGFDYHNWLQGLARGKSFVTTGPMLFSDVTSSKAAGTVLSQEPIDEIEVIVNGQIIRRLTPARKRNAEGAWETTFSEELKLDGTSWVAIRAWESHQNGQRWRFAHSAPQWFDVTDQPLRPRKHEISFLIDRVRESREKSAGLLTPQGLQEYDAAIQSYNSILSTARD